MKKKIIIPIIFGLIIIIGIIGFILFNNRVVATITLDINPSLKINLTKNEKVKNVVALNKDAEKIVNNDLKGKDLNESLKIITNKIIENDYVKDRQITILMNVDGSLNKEELEHNLKTNFGEKDIFTEVIIVDKITKEDEELAQKYQISPSKAAYIKSITEDIEEVNIESLINKPINELKETKETGNYCAEGYTLEGSFCIKQIDIEDGIKSKVCPEGYTEYNKKCYEETSVIDTDNLVCRDNYKLVDDKCIREFKENAIASKYTCSKGEAMTRVEAGLTEANNGDANDIVCVDKSNATHPMSPCEVNDGTEYTISGGKCYWHRAPVIAEGCPGKIKVNGFCWDDATNVLICVGARDGKRYKSKSEYCEGSIKYLNPTISEYKCEKSNAKLEGNKCIIEETEDAMHERVCESGFTLVNNDRCINYNKTTDFIDGYKCNKENSRVEKDKCIILDIVEANHNE